jgi:hypothetical protein
MVMQRKFRTDDANIYGSTVQTFRHGDLATWICATLSAVNVTQCALVTVYECMGLLIQHTECVRMEVLPAV